MKRTVLIVREEDLEVIKAHFAAQNGKEGVGYLFCGSSKVESDPWTGLPQDKFIARRFEAVSASSVLSSSGTHITWETSTFIRALRQCREEAECMAIVHYHPGGLSTFSAQDDRNEAELAELVQKRNGKNAKLLSLVLLSDGRAFGRVWSRRKSFEPVDLIFVVGRRYALHYKERGHGKPATFLNRQALALGNVVNEDLATLRIGVVGGGATGSATALLLPRLGVKNIALFDRDVVDETNLNRLHFASQTDAAEACPKVDAINRGIAAMELGTNVQIFRGWINDPDAREALKSCDVLFACTDDHLGRLLLNRFAYFYSTPVIDMGLAIHVGDGDPPSVHGFDGRVTVLQPGTTCLLCRGIINVERAFAESLKRTNPAEYERQKEEAYVIGEGDPNPAVVPFTTSVATMAVEELIHRLQGFRGPDGSVDQRLRQFHRGIDRRPGHQPSDECPICGSREYWGRGDMEPFLDANL
jgi:molybdopterin/thiamine biosynthesis adenylyltransferase